MADRRRPAVFLDRDGTVIEEADYLADPEGVVLVDGAARAIRSLKAAGYSVVLVTNQSGIARGLYSLDDYRAVARRLDDVLAAQDASPHGTYFCPHHPDFTGPCACRKPGLGMYLDAAGDLGLDLTRSFFVGDKASDVLPALEAGGVGILVRTGYGRSSREEVPAGVVIVDDVAEAARHILSVGEGSPVDPS